ncbi:hypothetical protein SAMN04515667_1110 [Formosa sp. Hel1_31_208]|uniref:hypothetical protein n=1 Tax=Formosa sp. Hel1_31_208 TaxID=1798225 RepID=UPI00087DCFAF|nr:hypothetical protein [Formosa sp. Hel1_31_208]SDR97131.1 hypothetical protein SAMN04515667_1110 [Formosa sp. Hel1_31_208]
MKIPKILTLCLCFVLLFTNTQCDEDDEVSSPCNQIVVIDNNLYDTAESDDFSLVSAEVNDNCLFINVSASGCDGNTWSMVLVDSGSIAESSPEQRFLKFIFSNDESCLAVFSQERSFDLTQLQINDSNEIVLNIDGFPEPLLYVY